MPEPSTSVFARAAELLYPAATVDSEWFKPNPGDAIRGRARAKQRPPAGDWFVWLLMTGRGFGKTRTAAEYIDHVARTQMSAGEQVLVSGRTPSDVRTFALYGEGGLLTHHPDIEYSPTHRELTWPNGVKGIIRSGANPEEFRGYSGNLAWLDEFAAWDYAEEAWDNLMFGVRERDPRICITTTPKPIPVLKRIMTSPTTEFITGSTLENRANLSERWVKTVIEPIQGTRLARQEVEAEFLEEAEGALWTRQVIEKNRRDPESAPDFVRVVNGVDPQGRAGGARMTGIVAAAEGADGHYYVVRDSSLSGEPVEWGTAVIETHAALTGDLVVAERNFGGDMVESVLRSLDRNLPVKQVIASRGKYQRAEPVAALYSRGLVHHLGVFPELEDEQCTWAPGERWSPNRLDGLVWALTELALGQPDRITLSPTWTPRRRM